MARRVLTDDQTKAFDEVERTLGSAFESARAKIAAAGFRADEDATFCTQCDCGDYVHRNGSDACARPGCGHVLTRHNVF
jgi:hypothetical protein